MRPMSPSFQQQQQVTIIILTVPAVSDTGINPAKHIMSFLKVLELGDHWKRVWSLLHVVTV